jgi:hypothetical protein
MDRDELTSNASHISARLMISSITVSVYLNAADSLELAEKGSVSVTQAYDDASADARVTEVIVYRT